MLSLRTCSHLLAALCLALVSGCREAPPAPLRDPRLAATRLKDLTQPVTPEVRSALRGVEISPHGTLTDAGFEVHDGALRVRIEPQIEGFALRAAAEGVADRASASGERHVAWLREDGAEDLGIVASPDRTEAAWRLTLSSQVAGLRLVENVLELLDEGGAPRLRMTAPLFVDAQDRPVPLRVEVTGCEVDRSPAPPWGRAVTPPGSARCLVRLAWNAPEAAHPLVLDPMWTTTTSMSVARERPFAVPLENDRVLVVGGGFIRMVSEIYDRRSGTWAVTGMTVKERSAPAGRLLKDGRVFVVGGGHAGTFGSASGEAWNPATGTWSLTGANLSSALGYPGFAPLEDGRLVVLGISDLPANTISCTVFDATASSASSCGSVYGSTSGSVAGVLVARDPTRGVYATSRNIGQNTAGPVLAATSSFSSPSSSWSSTGDRLSQWLHDASIVSTETGLVVIAGGSDQFGPSRTTLVFGSSHFTSAQLNVPAPNSVLAATRVGRVVLTGGYVHGSGYVGRTEWLDVANKRWVLGEPLATARGAHFAVPLGKFGLLVGGGDGESGPLSSVEIFRTPCTGAEDCPGGACVNGFCCDSGCSGSCDSCDLPGRAGLCQPKPQGATPAPSCRGALCDGTSSACPNVCSSSAPCPAGQLCSDGLCITPRAIGGECRGNGDCAQGTCVDGRCCSSACTGGCNRCDVQGKEGTCSVVSGATAECGGFLCDGASSECRASCTSSAECAGGYWCTGGSCVQKGAIGTACAVAAGCASGFCADGICCENACTNSCGACNLQGAKGLCRAVPRGTAPSPACGLMACDGSFANCPTGCSDDAGCLAGAFCNDGLCRAALAPGALCTRDAQCGTGFCADGRCCTGACDGACDRCDLAGTEGTCTPIAGEVTACGGYRCKGTSGSCPTTCAADGDCVTGLRCEAGACVPRLDQGEACADDGDCRSGACSSGVCCNVHCEGSCASCDLPGKRGQCEPVPDGALGSPSCSPYVCGSNGSLCPTRCTSDAQCDVRTSICRGGACIPKLPLGAACSQTWDCASGECTDGVCCDSACFGQCDRCDLPGSKGICTPLPEGTSGVCGANACSGGADCKTSCGTDADCASHAFCYFGNCFPKAALGQSCSSNGACTSGFCTDGVCCNSACDGQCAACNVTPGTCRAVSGPPRAGHAPCAGQGTSCRGTCDGVEMSACRYPSTNTVCRAASCTNGEAVSLARCDGRGACGAGETTSCAPYVCGPNACRTDCTSDAECANGLWCNAGACVAKHAAGDACAADLECASAFCTDGVCCARRCDGACEACAERGAEGLCIAVTGAPRAGHPECAGVGACGGSCDGVVASCRHPGATVECGAAACADGVVHAAATCDGAGACAPGSSSTCESGRCDGNACAPPTQQPPPDKPDQPAPRADADGCTSSPASALALLAALVVRRRRALAGR